MFAQKTEFLGHRVRGHRSEPRLPKEHGYGVLTAAEAARRSPVCAHDFAVLATRGRVKVFAPQKYAVQIADVHLQGILIV